MAWKTFFAALVDLLDKYPLAYFLIEADGPAIRIRLRVENFGFEEFIDRRLLEDANDVDGHALRALMRIKTQIESHGIRTTEPASQASTS